MRIIQLSPSSIAAPKHGCCHALLLPSLTGFKYQPLLALDLVTHELGSDIHLKLRQLSDNPIVNGWTRVSASKADDIFYCYKVVNDQNLFYYPGAYERLLGPSEFYYKLDDKEPPFLFDAYSYTSEDDYRKHLNREIPYEKSRHVRLAQLLLFSP